jgi:hypothetical protein
MARQAATPKLKPTDEVYLVSKVDRELQIPKEKRSFPNEIPLTFIFKAGVPQKVPFYAAESYSSAYPDVYKILSNEEAEVLLTQEPPKTSVSAQTMNTGNNFNVIEFLNNSHPVSRERLEVLGDKEIFQIAALLDLNPSPDTSKERLIEQILIDVEVKNI